MIKTAEYLEFENGFLKEAEAAGCDVPFLKGYIKQADEIVGVWKNAFDELADKSGDRLYRYKMANELLYANMIRKDLEKRALAEAPIQPVSNQYDAPIGPGQPVSNQYQSFLGNGFPGVGQMQKGVENFLSQHSSGNGMMSGVMKWLTAQLHNNPNLLSSLTVGGGGGGLLGLLLGALTGHPMTGMMLGGLGGAAISAYMGNKSYNDAANDWMNPKPNPEPKPEPNAQNNPALASFYHPEKDNEASIMPGVNPIQPPLPTPHPMNITEPNPMNITEPNPMNITEPKPVVH